MAEGPKVKTRRSGKDTLDFMREIGEISSWKKRNGGKKERKGDRELSNKNFMNSIVICFNRCSCRS